MPAMPAAAGVAAEQHLQGAQTPTAQTPKARALPVAYLAQHRLLDHLPSLWADVRVPEIWSEPYEQTNVWFGTSGTVRPLALIVTAFLVRALCWCAVSICHWPRQAAAEVHAGTLFLHRRYLSTSMCTSRYPISCLQHG